MKRRSKAFVFAALAAFSLSGCNLLPTLPVGEISSSSSSQYSESSRESSSSSSSRQSSSQDSSSSSSLPPSSSSIPDNDNCSSVTKHVWVNILNVSPGNPNQVGYTVDKCAICSAKKYEIRAMDGLLADGSSFKSATPDGYMKLNGNGQSISYTFHLDEAIYGTIYMKGYTDSSAINSGAGFYTTGTSNSATQEEGNFRIEVNGVRVDYSQARGVPYAVMLEGGEPGPSDNDSPVNYCEVGEVTLNSGINTIRYTRVASYTLQISHFAIITSDAIQPHEHSYNENVWSYNEYGHWHPCRYGDSSRGNYSEHIFTDWMTINASSCEESTEQRCCTICAYTETRAKDMENHYSSYLLDLEKEAGYASLSVYECLNCGKQAYRWNAQEYDQELSNDIENNSQGYVRFVGSKPENRDGVEQRGAHLIYKINMPCAASNVGLAFNIVPSNATGGYPIFDTVPNDSVKGYDYDAQGNLVLSEKRYGLWVNGVKIQLGVDPYPSVVNSSQKWYDWPVKFNLKQGENTIDLCCYGSYRARMYEFQVTGVVNENIHRHTLSNWQFDDTYHWKVCTDGTCPSGHGAQFLKEKHKYGTPVQNNEGNYVYTCTVCGKQRIRFGDALEQEWLSDDLIDACNNPNVKAVNYNEGYKGIKSNSITGEYSITLTCTSNKARLMKLQLFLSIKISNISQTGFWYQNNAEKFRVTVNGETVEPPTKDLDFQALGCTEQDPIAIDSTVLSVPVWIDICDINLVAGENIIEFKVINSSYSFFLCGAKIIEY